MSFLNSAFGRKILCGVLAGASYALAGFIDDQATMFVGLGSFFIGLAVNLGGEKSKGDTDAGG